MSIVSSASIVVQVIGTRNVYLPGNEASNGDKNWEQERGWLTDSVLTAQDRFKVYLDYFQIKY